LLVQNGDLEGYRRHCAEVLARSARRRSGGRRTESKGLPDFAFVESRTYHDHQDGGDGNCCGHQSLGLDFFQFTKGLAEYAKGALLAQQNGCKTLWRLGKFPSATAKPI